MGKSKPKAPDPHATASAQGAMNRDTAITQQWLNMINQTGPWGDISYEQTGTAPDGTPTFTQTTDLSPGQQALFDSGVNAQQGLVDYANRLVQSLGQSGPLQIDPNSLPALQSGFGPSFNQQFQQNPNLSTQLGAGYNPMFQQNPNLSTELGSAFDPRYNQQLDLATSYAGAEDFSADRQRYEDALWERTAGDRSNQEAALRTQLANKGIREGSAAWNAEMERLQRQNTDARLATLMAGGEEQQRMVGLARDAAIFGNQALTGMGQFDFATQQAQNAAAQQQFMLENEARMGAADFDRSSQQMQNQSAAQQFMLENEARLGAADFDRSSQQMQNAAAAQQAGFGNTARQQALQEQISLHNQPLNEITAMLGLGSVGSPAGAYGTTPQTGVAGVDYAGLVNQNYQNQMANYQNQMGGLFGLGSSVLGLGSNLLGAAGAAGGFGSLFSSDERLKTDVKRVGTTDDGVPIYTYRYIWGGPIHMGVMAQDVPDAAVETESGYLAVDYGKVT